MKFSFEGGGGGRVERGVEGERLGPLFLNFSGSAPFLPLASVNMYMLTSNNALMVVNKAWVDNQFKYYSTRQAST